MCLAVPGRVISVAMEDGVRTGVIDFGGVRRKACLLYEPGAVVGSYVVVHAGFAVSVVTEDEAARSYQLLTSMSDLID